MPHNVYENIYEEFAQRGRCGSCGFFAKYAPLMPGLGKFEAGWPERESGNVFLHNPTLEPRTKRPIITVPLCAEGIVQFSMLMDGKADAEKLKSLLAEPRECREWGEYIATIGPQEMLDREGVQRLETDRRNFELSLHRNSRITQGRMERIARWQFALSVIAIVVGVFATYAITRFTTTEFSYSGEPLPVVLQEPSPTATPALVLEPSPTPDLGLIPTPLR